MRDDGDIRAEIEALRHEIAALRAEQMSAARSGDTDKADTAVGSDGANVTDQLRTLAEEISAVSEEMQKGVIKHPLPSVLGALILGFLIGRVLPR
jgi:hypothetical protein